ncbi:hypothetical protein M3Y97_00565600 [Aphelenchoides bicaudatus]|nr:hypothetical protein M3Y97_00565600 [Aphelenchoides bicaudatus]
MAPLPFFQTKLILLTNCLFLVFSAIALYTTVFVRKPQVEVVAQPKKEHSSVCEPQVVAAVLRSIIIASGPTNSPR